MKKLKTIIQYQCTTSFKYIWYFYGIELLIISLIFLITTIAMGNTQQSTVSCLETNTIIYVGILGILGFKEDFKMLIQNGFTRKYIFIAILSMFCFISGIMALVDTIIGNVLRQIIYAYLPTIESIYGNNNIFMNWLLLFLLYLVICELLYLIVLIINKAGKNLSICLGVFVGGIVFLLTAFFQYVLSDEVVNSIVEFITKAMGFMNDGTINYLFPALTLLVLVTILGVSSYVVIRRTELK